MWRLVESLANVSSVLLQLFEQASELTAEQLLDALKIDARARADLESLDERMPFADE